MHTATKIQVPEFLKSSIQSVYQTGRDAAEMHGGLQWTSSQTKAREEGRKEEKDEEGGGEEGRKE